MPTVRSPKGLIVRLELKPVPKRTSLPLGGTALPLQLPGAVQSAAPPTGPLPVQTDSAARAGTAANPRTRIVAAADAHGRLSRAFPVLQFITILPSNDARS